MVARILGRELRELAQSRALWLMLIVTGALVGHGFIDAAGLYAEVSGAGGGPAALSQGLNPLTGIVVPTLGMYDLVSTLLFPFVAIRMFAAERESGALALTLQVPSRFSTVIACKAAALFIAWVASGIPALIALVWWRAIGGHLYAPEVATVVLGHLLRGALTIGIGAAAGAFAANSASAAIIALSVTLGAWAVDYAAAANGGWFRTLAEYTPESALRVFEQGELRASVILVMLATTLAGLGMAWQWMRVGLTVSRRAAGVAAVGVAMLATMLLASRLHSSRDMSEDRHNSFTVADERALQGIHAPLSIAANLAPEDPRLVDLERGVFAKLRRTLPDVSIEYTAQERTGLFAAQGEHYGEVWYTLGGKRAMSRSATEEIVLSTIYELAGIAPQPSDQGPTYGGYPLRRTPGHAAIVFFVLWPLLVVFTWWRLDRVPATRSQSR